MVWFNTLKGGPETRALQDQILGPTQCIKFANEYMWNEYSTTFVFHAKHPNAQPITHNQYNARVLLIYELEKKMYTNTLASFFGNSPRASGEMVDHEIRPDQKKINPKKTSLNNSKPMSLF